MKPELHQRTMMITDEDLKMGGINIIQHLRDVLEQSVINKIGDGPKQISHSYYIMDNNLVLDCCGKVKT